MLRIASYALCAASIASYIIGLALFQVWDFAHIVCGGGMIGFALSAPFALQAWNNTP